MVPKAWRAFSWFSKLVPRSSPTPVRLESTSWKRIVEINPVAIPDMTKRCQLQNISAEKSMQWFYVPLCVSSCRHQDRRWTVNHLWTRHRRWTWTKELWSTPNIEAMLHPQWLRGRKQTREARGKEEAKLAAVDAESSSLFWWMSAEASGFTLCVSGCFLSKREKSTCWKLCSLSKMAGGRRNVPVI